MQPCEDLAWPGQPDYDDTLRARFTNRLHLFFRSNTSQNQVADSQKRQGLLTDFKILECQTQCEGLI